MTALQRICIVTSGHLATNPRVVKEATALSNAGYDLTIVHGDYMPTAREIDSSLAERRWKRITVPFGPFQRSRLRYFLQTARRRAAKFVMRAGWGPAGKEHIAYAPICPGLVSAAASVPADLYIAHYVAALPAAAWAARRRGAKFAFDAEDFHLGDLPDAPEHSFEKRLIRAIEARHLPEATYITAASPMISEAYVEAYGIPAPTILLNTFSKTNAPAAPSPRGTASPGPSIYWFSQTIGPGRGVETAVAACARARSKPHLYLRGVISKEFEAALLSLAQRVGLADRIHFLPFATPQDLERLGASYDLGYSGESGFSPNRSRALANKIFSYLLSGLPCLASDVPSHQRLAPEIGDAVSLFPVGDITALAAAMDGFLLNPERLAAARRSAFELGQQRFNWETQTPVLLSCVAQALASGKQAA